MTPYPGTGRASHCIPSQCRVYVGTYGKFNNGSLFGAWLDLSDYATRKSFTKPAGNFTRTRKMRNICFRIGRTCRRA